MKDIKSKTTNSKRQNYLNAYVLFFLTFHVLLLTFYLAGCAEKTPNLSDFPINDPPSVVGDTTYIPLQPPFSGFNQPEDILIGFEPVLYIADKGNNRIVQMDFAGAVISYSEFILHPRKIAQDRNFDLLVIASKIDTIPPNILDTVDAVYRIKVGTHGTLNGLTPMVVFKSNQPTPLPGDHGGFNGIAAYYDNYYLVSRSGPNNGSPIDPDNAIFRIDKYDNTNPVPERLSGFELEGSGLLSLQKISAIVTFPNNLRDLIYVQNYPDVVFKIQWCVYDDIEGIYNAKFTPESNVDLLKPNIVADPRDVTVDQFGNIFIVDVSMDSLFKFNSVGKFKKESFGGEGTALNKMIDPQGVAFYYKTLYICDSGNNRILRFVLSTDKN